MIMVSTDMISSETSPWLAHVSLLAISSRIVPLSLFSHIGLQSTNITSFYLNYLFKGPISKRSHIVRCWVVGLQHMSRYNSAYNS